METWVSVLVFGAVYALAIGVGKDRWCLLFAVTASFFGVAWIVDPDITLRMSPAFTAKDSHDVIIHYFLRPLGLYRLFHSVLMVQCWRTGDKVFQSTMFFSCALAIFLCFSEGYFVLGRYMFSAFFWVVGCVYHLLASRDLHFGRSQTNSALTRHLRIDFLLLFLLSVFWLHLPIELCRWQFHVPGIADNQKFFILNVGAFQIGSSFISLMAPGFQRTEEKKMVLIGRCIVYLATILIMWISRFTNPTLFATNGVAVTMLYFIAMTANTLIGIASDDVDKPLKRE